MSKTGESSLDKILASRTRRAERQRELISVYKCSLICFTLNMPGPVKDSTLNREMHSEGLSFLKKLLKEEGFEIIYKESYCGDAGPETYICVDADPFWLKRMLVGIEESHELGRLFDMDVIAADGRLIKRAVLGFEERKCIVCGDNYHICRRSNSHSLETLRAQIIYLVQGYFGRKRIDG